MTLFEKYSYRQKNVALLILIGLLSVVSYKRSFSKTIETSRYISELKGKKMVALQSYEKIQNLNQEIASVNGLLGKENVSIERVQQSFLNYFAENSKNLDVNQIEEVYGFDHPDFRINTFRIDVKGDFVSTLQFVNKLEKEYHEARLIHAFFDSEKNRETEKLELITTLLLQNYVQRSN